MEMPGMAWHGTARCPPCCHHTTYLLCHVLAPLEIVVTIRQDLGLHDGHNAVLQQQNRQMPSQ